MLNISSYPVWLVTGCSTGFGRELVKQLLSRGYKVVITARDTSKIKDLAIGYETSSLVLPLDVTNPDQIAHAVQAAEAKFGQVDVLVNNAGYGYFSSFEEGEEQKIKDQFDTNVFGLIKITQAVLPLMRKQRRGFVVNISSIGGLRSFGATGFYNASKFAVEGLSESLALETAHLGIKVLIVEPGPFRTDWAGRSSSHTPLAIADYEPTVGARLKAISAVSGKQVGDPAKGAAAIITAVESPEPPFRLLLGQVAYDLAIDKLKSLQQNFEQWKDLTFNTDFPASQ